MRAMAARVSFVRKGLRMLLESREAVALAAQHQPDIVVMDLATGLERHRGGEADLQQRYALGDCLPEHAFRRGLCTESAQVGSKGVLAERLRRCHHLGQRTQLGRY